MMEEFVNQAQYLVIMSQKRLKSIIHAEHISVWEALMLLFCNKILIVYCLTYRNSHGLCRVKCLEGTYVTHSANVIVTGASDVDDVLVKRQTWVERHCKQLDGVSELHVSSCDPHTLWLIDLRQIQDGGRPPFWKTVKSPYISTTADSLAADRPLKFRIFENARRRRLPSWKSQFTR